MTHAEQEALFATLRATHTDWSTQFVSGYVAGVVDEGIKTRPSSSLIHRRDQYAVGYLVGFAVHRGSDVEEAGWFGFVGDLVKGLRSAPGNKERDGSDRG